MNKLAITTILVFQIFHVSFSQTINEIKADNQNYLWGEGYGVTLKKADQEALAMLISQISTQVESSFTLLKDEISKNGNSESFSETFHSVIKTYSGATLKNTERIVLGNEPDAKVFRYIKRDEIAKVFNERREKILGFAKNAETSLEKNQIADALRYYYWSLTLLKSHPDGNSIEYWDELGQKHLLATWLPMQMNNVFSNVKISVASSEKDTDLSIYTLKIEHKQGDAQNFDYSYWDGSDWSNIVSSRNGIGYVELYGMASDTKKIRIKAEYIFEGEARIDRELEDVLSKVDPVPFRNSYYNIELLSETNNQKLNISSDVEEVSVTKADNDSDYEALTKKLIQEIKSKNYGGCESLFTPDGYDVFNKLITYGNAKVIGNPDIRFIAFENKVIGRSIPMSFNFKTNNKQFVENVILHFNKEKKIENLSFGLTKVALDDIIKKEIWKEHDRLVLVNFLENYKTAYALKRINYLEQIFADDALIITGKIVKVKPNEQNRFQGNQIVKYNKQTKQQYLNNLRYSFNSKEYVNLKFEDSKIRRAGKGGDIYGIQIKQNYFSSNYGDVGYLFLMVDLNNPTEPIIHVRTWQPQMGINDNIYGLSDFN